MTTPGPLDKFAVERVAEFLRVLELIASGDTSERVPISDRHDALDAMAHAINVLVGELAWTTAKSLDAQKERAAIAERENASKNIFFRNMSHEIRTPIMAMLGFADLLSSSDTAQEDAPELVRRLRANGLAVLSLLDDLLDLAKLDANKIVLNPETVSVVDVVRDVFESLNVDSQAKNLEMRVNATPAALGAMMTDRYRLRQILVNVVGNAVKFTNAGRVVVSLSTARESDGDRWTVDITDTGIGISPDRHPFLFEPFEQGGPTIPRAYGGSGLGLALSRRLAEQLGGSLVLLRSAPGEGTAFRLMLTALRTDHQSADASMREAADDGSRSVQGMRILLAEDHVDLNFALRRLLERAGATVESAYDGEEAVAKAVSMKFDAILMDLRLPQMDGLQATRELRSQSCAIPIIAITADPATVSRDAALDAGCDDCLSKPFEIDDLMESIRQSAQH